jgi:hypothetical protein
MKPGGGRHHRLAGKSRYEYRLENVKITATKSFSIANARAVPLKNVVVTVPNARPFKLENAPVGGLNRTEP